MLFYEISTGRFSDEKHTFGYGYSGFGIYKDNVAAVERMFEGPIPPGDYSLSEPYKSDHLGVLVFNLNANAGTETFGRTLFRIHGDNKDHTASHGCIVLGPYARQEIANSKERILRVIP